MWRDERSIYGRRRRAKGYSSVVCISDCRSRSEITEQQERTAAELMPRGKCLDKSKDIFPVLCPARNRFVAFETT